MTLPSLNGQKPAGFLHSLPRRLQPEVPSATAAVHAAWTSWRIPRQVGKEVIKANEIDVLGVPVAGTLGRILLPRPVASIALSSWF